jgi:hypothetical protein
VWQFWARGAHSFFVSHSQTLTVSICAIDWKSLVALSEIVEQAMVHHQYHHFWNTVGWLFMSASGVSVGLYTTILIGISSITFPDLADTVCRSIKPSFPSSRLPFSSS